MGKHEPKLTPRARLLDVLERHFDATVTVYGEHDDRPRMLLSALQRLERGEESARVSVRELWASLFACKLEGHNVWRALVAAITNLASDAVMCPVAGTNSARLALCEVLHAFGNPPAEARALAEGEVARAVGR